MKPWMTWAALSLTYALVEFAWLEGNVSRLIDASYYTAAGMFAFWFWHTPSRKETA